MPKIKSARVYMQQAERRYFKKDVLGRVALGIMKQKAKKHGFSSIKIMGAKHLGLGIRYRRYLKTYHLTASRGSILKMAAVAAIWLELGNSLYRYALEHELRHVRNIEHMETRDMLARAFGRGRKQRRQASEVLVQVPVLNKNGRFRRFYMPKEKYVQNACLDLINHVLMQTILTGGKDIDVVKLPKPVIKNDFDRLMGSEYSFLKPAIRKTIQRRVFEILDKFNGKAIAMGIEPIIAK